MDSRIILQPVIRRNIPLPVTVPEAAQLLLGLTSDRLRVFIGGQGFDVRLLRIEHLHEGRCNILITGSIERWQGTESRIRLVARVRQDETAAVLRLGIVILLTLLGGQLLCRIFQNFSFYVLDYLPLHVRNIWVILGLMGIFLAGFVAIAAGVYHYFAQRPIAYAHWNSQQQLVRLVEELATVLKQRAGNTLP